MMKNSEFTLKKYLETNENLLYKDTKERLQYWEKDLLILYFWYKISRKEIARHLESKKSYYKNSHLFGHKVPELRRRLSEALNEPITRSIIKEPLRREWQRITGVYLTDIDLFINFLVYADESINFTDLEIEVLRGSLEKKTYKEITDNISRSCRGKECKSIWKCKCKHDEDYIRRDVGSSLWTKVSAIMGVKVDKRNCIEVFKTWQEV